MVEVRTVREVCCRACDCSDVRYMTDECEGCEDEGVNDRGGSPSTCASLRAPSSSFVLVVALVVGVVGGSCVWLSLWLYSPVLPEIDGRSFVGCEAGSVRRQTTSDD